MFLGVLHANARKVLAACIPHVGQNVHVLCSGNFTIEATLRLNGYKGALTGSDVSLYACTLGAYFAGQDLPLQMNTGLFPEFEPLLGYMRDREGRAAAVALALDMLAVYRRKNLYQQRMWRHYERGMVEMAERTILKLRKRKDALKLDAFFARDAWERAVEINEGDDHVVISFSLMCAPGHKRLYEDLDRLFTWEAPKYRVPTTEAEFAGRILQRYGRWIFGTEKREAELDALLGAPFAEAPRETRVRIHLYTNIPAISPKVVRRKVRAERPPWPRLTDDDAIGLRSRLTVHRVKSTEARYVRQVYASVEIGQASAQFSYAVAVDGKCIGILLLELPTYSMKIGGVGRRDESIYMVADIAVTSERYPRLSKLLLMAALSREIRHDLEARMVREVAFNITTAFSRKQVSMKYRGVFKLLSRKEENGVFILTYYGRMGQWSLDEAMRRWAERYLGSEGGHPVGQPSLRGSGAGAVSNDPGTDRVAPLWPEQGGAA